MKAIQFTQYVIVYCVKSILTYFKISQDHNLLPSSAVMKFFLPASAYNSSLLVIIFLSFYYSNTCKYPLVKAKVCNLLLKKSKLAC